MPTPLGRILDPGDLFGRERELANAWHLLDVTKSNILYSAPRRVGKSSFLNRLASEASVHGYCPVQVKLPDCESEDQFVHRLLAESWERDGNQPIFESFIKSTAGRVLRSVRFQEYEFKPDVPRDWEQMSSAVTAMLKASPEPKLFLIDELPLFVATLLNKDPERGRARRFLGWMKSLRDETRHRWVLAGSIGLDTIARRARLSGTIADLHIDTGFGPFDRTKADEFLRHEARGGGIELTDGMREELLRLTHAYHVPYYLVLLMNEVRRCAHENEKFSVNNLLDKRAHFSHWDERLYDIFGVGTRDRVDELLSEAAVSPDGMMADAALNILGTADGKEILDVLINDSYLHLAEGRLRFRCELIRLYWSRFVAR